MISQYSRRFWMISVLSSCRSIERRYEKFEELIRESEFELLLTSSSMLKKSDEFVRQTDVIFEDSQEQAIIWVLIWDTVLSKDKTINLKISLKCWMIFWLDYWS